MNPSKQPPITVTSANRATINVTSPNTCSEGTFHVNSTLQGGHNAGRFEYQGRVRNVLKCLKRCCDLKDCDLAYMGMDGSCYSVHCKNEVLCKAVPVIGGESSSVFYVSRKTKVIGGKKFIKTIEKIH